MDEYTEEIKAMMEEVLTRESRRQTYLHENFPKWTAIEAAIESAFTNTAQKMIVKKMARLMYLFFKNLED